MKLFVLNFLPFLSTLRLAFAAEGLYSYDPASNLGPDHWGELPIAGNQCNGQKNSPISVMSSECDMFADYQLDGGTCGFQTLDYDLTNNGVKVGYPSQGCIRPQMEIPGIDGIYEALQFHVHTSSEHTIDDRFFGAELHVVHQKVGGDRFAVFGFMIQSGAPHDDPMFETLLEGWNAAELRTVTDCLGRSTRNEKKAQSEDRGLGGKRRRLHGFNVYDFMPDDISFYHYDGGLTTPPCSEVVWWNLADTPLSISTRQFNKMVDLTLNYLDKTSCELSTLASPSGSTSRPVQPLNGRTVTRICPSSSSSRRGGGQVAPTPRPAVPTWIPAVPTQRQTPRPSPRPSPIPTWRQTRDRRRGKRGKKDGKRGKRDSNSRLKGGSWDYDDYFDEWD